MIHQSAGNGAVSAADRAPARAPGLPYGQLDASSALFAAASPQAPLLELRAASPVVKHFAPPSPQPLDLGPAAAEQPDALDKPSCPAFAGFSATHADRPRERLAALGPQGLSDAQLLAIFLGTGVAGKSAGARPDPDPALGSLRGVLGAHPAALRQVHGIGPAKMSLLRAIGIAA